MSNDRRKDRPTPKAPQHRPGFSRGLSGGPIHEPYPYQPSRLVEQATWRSAIKNVIKNNNFQLRPGGKRRITI